MRLNSSGITAAALSIPSNCLQTSLMPTMTESQSGPSASTSLSHREARSLTVFPLTPMLVIRRGRARVERGQGGVDRGHVALAERGAGPLADRAQPAAVGHGVADEKEPGAWGDFTDAIVGRRVPRRSIPGR